MTSLTGCSPGDLIRNIRLDEAAKLIEKQFGNITRSLGYSKFIPGVTDIVTAHCYLAGCVKLII